MENLLSQRLELFQNLISCGQSLYYWEFDPELKLVSTSCDSQELLKEYFVQENIQKILRRYLHQGSKKPLIIYNVIGLSWIAAAEIAGDRVSRVHVIGPAFTSDISFPELEQELVAPCRTRSQTVQLLEQMKGLPIIPMVSWMHYGLMLHYCVTNEKLDVSDYNYQDAALTLTYDEETTTNSPFCVGTWLAEQAALQMIEDGNLEYQNAFGRLSMADNNIPMTDFLGSIRVYKDYVISFITLATRAAIRGGLNVEIAYCIGDLYIRSVEEAACLTDLVRINNTMFEDFVNRVHKLKTSDSISRSIQACCHYIEIHLSEKITVRELARQVGYSESHLAQKFKRETGLSVVEYIHRQRIEQGKRMLQSSTESIQDISDRVGFCNPSYFAEQFRKYTGLTPGEYRKRYVD